MSCTVYAITFFVSMTYHMKMVTALFAKTLEELQNQNELTPSSQAYIHIHIAQDKIQWQAIVNTIMNVGFPSKVGNFMTS
jgi:hypothetical protein